MTPCTLLEGKLELQVFCPNTVGPVVNRIVIPRSSPVPCPTPLPLTGTPPSIRSVCRITQVPSTSSGVSVT